LPTLNIDQVRRPKSPMGATLLVAALLVAFTIVVAGVLVLGNRNKPVSSPEQSVALTTADGGRKAEPAHVSALGEENGDSDPGKDGKASGGVEPAEKTEHEKRTNPREELGKDVLAKLEQAEDLFEKGQYQEAVRFALQSIGIQDSQRGRLLLTVSYCALSDLGNAVASLHKLPEQERAKARKTCRELGLNL
jgi:hypothetical protein